MTGVPAPQPVAERVAALREERDRFARETVEQASSSRFPSYDLPAIAVERFPGLDLLDPSTWPEPDRCTEGRPWGIDAYGSLWGSPEDRWASYLSRRSRPCRNRWRDETTRLCGTHLRPYRERVADSRKRVAARERETEHRDLAHRLAEHGIEAEGRPTGVVLDAANTLALLDLLDARRGPAPTHDRPR